MSYKEYIDKDFTNPYCYVIKSPDFSRALYYFGEAHSFDPDFPQWDELRSFWREFLATAGQKRVALVEGGVRDVWPTEREAILEDGGMGLLAYLAAREGIQTLSPEPDDAFERAELEKRFSRDEIQYYYFARMAHQWMRKEDQKPDFVMYMKRSLESDKRKSGWKGYEFSFEHMMKVHERIFGSPLDPFDKKTEALIYGAINPARLPGGIVNAVSRASSEVRDLFIAGEIERLWKEGYSIFANFGSAHPIMQEPLLRDRLS